MRTSNLPLFAALSGMLFVNAESALAQGTSFTYQGRLNEGGGAATGLYDFQFQAWNASSGGSSVGPVSEADGVAVSNGLFTASPD